MKARARAVVVVVVVVVVMVMVMVMCLWVGLMGRMDGRRRCLNPGGNSLNSPSTRAQSRPVHVSLVNSILSKSQSTCHSLLRYHRRVLPRVNSFTRSLDSIHNSLRRELREDSAS